jgi:catechol 2,3-dioxygenase-like lactoylglutathione lyase family enzyme
MERMILVSLTFKQPPLQNVDFVQLPVPDVVEASQWYIEHLGFTYMNNEPKPGDDMCFMVLSEGTFIILKEEKETQGLKFNEGTAAVWFKTKQIAALHDYLQTIGARISFFDNGSGFKFLSFFDPYGNAIGVIQDIDKYDPLVKQLKRALGRELNEKEQQNMRKLCDFKEWEMQDALIAMLKEINRKMEEKKVE